jgi:1A family penicillin-binding protein
MKRFLSYLFLIFIICALGFTGYFFIITKNLPDPELFDQRQINQSTKIFDRTGDTLLYEIHGEEKRTVIPYSDIPDYVKHAAISIEDVKFYEHSGIDWQSLARALLVNLKSGRIVQGGSTISQQLAKNAFLTPERTISRKIKELILTLRLEKKYSKDEILNLYLNQIPYGSNAYGIEAAAQTFFEKKAKDLSINEAALLASLPRAPSYYSPYGTHVDVLMDRKNHALKQMMIAKYITKEEYEEAKNGELEFSPHTIGIKAPHFVITLQEYLNDKYGEDFVQKGGLKVISTLDWDMQQIAERVIREGAERNSNLYNGKNASLVAQDANTGQILALVGSKDYFDTDNDGNFNVAVQGLRQPGSAIKPFAYVTAFKNGFSPETVVFDTLTDFDTTGKRSYTPHNFDDKFRGPVNLRNALAQSMNVPSVKVLYLAGVGNTLKTAADFGITTLTERSRYGLSLALGGGEVKLIDLVGAYSVFAQDGLKHEQSMILRIEDSKGEVLEEYKDDVDEVMDPQHIRLINDILTDIEVRRQLYQSSLHLTTFPNKEVALKTGTTNEYHDAWAMGYTPSLVTGVWVGNNDNTPMQQRGSSILAALPIWNAFLKEVLVDQPLETFERPEPVNVQKPILKGNYVIDGEIHNILHYINKSNPDGSVPVNPRRDSQYDNWEKALVEWMKDNPDKVNELALINKKLSINIEKPTNGSFINKSFSVKAKIQSSQEIRGIEIYFNNKLIGQRSGNFGLEYTYQDNFNLKDIKSQNALKIKVTDSDNKKLEEEIVIYHKNS